MADALTVTIGGRTARVDRTTDGGLTVDDKWAGEIAYGTTRGELVLRDGIRQTRVFVVQSKEETWVFHDGRTFLATVDTDDAGRRRAAHAHGSLVAPMPATVIAVNVRPRDAVKAGDVLILLEAMKMELPLRASGDGVVSGVHCAAGDLVQPNVPLVDFEASSKP